ncbi:MAG TPA: glycosyltransferase, partial [Orrella sp.]
MVISTKAPTYAIKHPAHVLHLVHTVRVFDDMFETAFPVPNAELWQQRATIHALEFEPLSQVKARFANGKESSDRLYRWRGMHAQVLHPPLLKNNFEQGPTGDYFFLPGRLHSWKRVDLIIEAVLGSSYPFKLKIAGTGDDLDRLQKIADNDPRIEFLGRISDEEVITLYANALAVPFTP